MSTIGIIGAMESEIISFCESFSAKESAYTGFYEASFGNNTVVICKCGIGKVNAAVCAQKLIDLYKVDYLINSGVAGGIGSNVKVFDIVISKDLTYHDFTPLEILESYHPYKSRFTADERLIELSKAACEKLISHDKASFACHVGTIVSGDCFVNSTETALRLRENFNALCTEMEGAAIAHAASRENIPFVVIRSISDFADDNADFDFTAFEKEAAKNAAFIVTDIINSL